ncbi:MAG: FAD-dependent oxidoreductase [archaeon]
MIPIPKIIDGELSGKTMLTDRLAIFSVRLFQPMPFVAGQFVTMGIRDDPVVQKRAFSVASSPNNPDVLEFFIKRTDTGTFTSALFSKDVGQPMQVIGPSGDFVLDTSAKRITFISAGAGISPFMSMVRKIIEDDMDIEVVFIQGVSYEKCLAFREELEGYARDHERFSYVPTISREAPDWNGERGRAESILPRIIQAPEGLGYICGPPAMVQNTKLALKDLGFSDGQIRVESW